MAARMKGKERAQRDVSTMNPVNSEAAHITHIRRGIVNSKVRSNMSTRLKLTEKGNGMLAPISRNLHTIASNFTHFDPISIHRWRGELRFTKLLV
jgi:hypothetical protein